MQGERAYHLGSYALPKAVTGLAMALGPRSWQQRGLLLTGQCNA